MRLNLLLGLSAVLTVASVAADEEESKVVVTLDESLSVLEINPELVVKSAEQLFRHSCPEEAGNPSSPIVRQSSYDSVTKDAFEAGEVYASSSSFIRGAVEAWAQHQHFYLRPDEVWFEILVQLNYYMEKNAEKIRHIFVTHEGKEAITIRMNLTKETVHLLISEFGKEVGKRVKAKWLVDWVKPGFSTSTYDDNLTATVLLMGLVQQYFDFRSQAICGLPSVTLLGTQNDWETLRSKLDNLKEFGEEPAEFAMVLTPILDGFVNTWKNPNSTETKSFWSKIVNGNALDDRICDKFDRVSGWITAFYFWNKQGNMVISPEQRAKLTLGAMLGDVRYLPQHLDDLPVSYAKVPVKLLDVEGKETSNVYLLAGNIGVYRVIDKDGRPMAEPLSGWYMYGPVDTSYRRQRHIGSEPELGGIKDVFGQCPRITAIG